MDQPNSRVALITGAGRGIGAETARMLAERGVAVALCARKITEIANVAADIETAGGRAIALPCDVSDYGQVAGFVEATHTAFGRIDIVINNAGILAPESPLIETDPGAWSRNVAINLTGAYYMARATIAHLCASDDGVLINVTSGAAHRALANWSAYCSAKAGLAMLTQCLHVEHGSDFRAYGFAPGTVWTKMQEDIRARGISEIAKLPETSLHSPARPAHVIAWLTSAEANDLAGQELKVQDDELRRRAGVPAELEKGGR